MRRRWELIFVDFITDLFRIPGTGTNAVMVMVDRLFKIAYFILLYFNESKAFNYIVAKFLFNNIFKLYNLLREIILNRDRRFIFKVARQLY